MKRTVAGSAPRPGSRQGAMYFNSAQYEPP